MKVVLLSVVIVAAFAGVYSDPPSPEMIKIVTDCMSTASVTLTPTEVHDLMHMKVPADTQPKKCFIKCFGEKTFVLDAAGKPNATTLKPPLLPECFDKAKMTDAVITECSAKTGATPCDVGYEAGKCLMEKAGMPPHSSEED